MIRTGVASKPTITREVTIEPTMCEVAQAFCDMGSDEQALFFHEVALVFMSWGGYQRDHQVLDIASKMNPGGSGAAFVRLLWECIYFPDGSPRS